MLRAGQPIVFSLSSVASGPLLLPVLLFFFLFFSQLLLFLSLPFCFLKESQGRQKKTFFLGAEQRLKDWHDKEAIRRDAQRVGMKGGAEHRVCCAVCACAECVKGACSLPACHHLS